MFEGEGGPDLDGAAATGVAAASGVLATMASIPASACCPTTRWPTATLVRRTGPPLPRRRGAGLARGAGSSSGPPRPGSANAPRHGWRTRRSSPARRRGAGEHGAQGHRRVVDRGATRCVTASSGSTTLGSWPMRPTPATSTPLAGVDRRAVRRRTARHVLPVAGRGARPRRPVGRRRRPRPRRDLPEPRLSAQRVGDVTTLRGQLSGDGAHIAESALDQIADELFRRYTRDVGLTGEPVPRRPQLLAEAFVELCRRGLAVDVGGTRAPRAEATVVVNAAEPDRVFDATGAPLADPSVLLCDAVLWPIVTSFRSVPLAAGTSCTVSPAPHQVRAVNLRDGGCVFPGCDAPAPWTDTHHADAWGGGGQLRHRPDVRPVPVPPPSGAPRPAGPSTSTTTVGPDGIDPMVTPSGVNATNGDAPDPRPTTDGPASARPDRSGAPATLAPASSGTSDVSDRTDSRPILMSGSGPQGSSVSCRPVDRSVPRLPKTTTGVSAERESASASSLVVDLGPPSPQPIAVLALHARGHAPHAPTGP